MKSLKVPALVAALPATLALLCSPVLAQTTATASETPVAAHAPASTAEPTAPKSGGYFGVGVASTPVYQGTDERRDRAGVQFGYQWANGLSVGSSGIGWRLSQQPDLQYGVGLGFNPGRKEGDSIYLKGMGDVKGQVTFGGYVNAAIAKGLWLTSSLELGAGDTREGAVLKVGAAYSVPINASLGLSFSAGVAIANANYMENYFGVNAAQSAASGHAVYTPSAGFRNATIGVGLNYKLAPKWTLATGLTGTALSSAAKDSPLVRQPNYVTGLIGVGYSF